MIIGLFFFVLILQLVSALIVFVVLKRNLNRDLTDVALERFETLRIQEDLSQIKEILVVTIDTLSDEILLRIKQIANKRFKDISLNFAQNQDIKGGMIIIVGDHVIDCSIKTRLAFLWGNNAKAAA